MDMSSVGPRMPLCQRHLLIAKTHRDRAERIAMFDTHPRSFRFNPNLSLNLWAPNREPPLACSI